MISSGAPVIYQVKELTLDSGRTNGSMVLPRMEEFPYMYQIDVNKNSTITHNRNGNNWDILFRRAVQNWEMTN